MRIILTALITFGFCSVAMAETKTEDKVPAVPTIKEVNFLCERDVDLPVIFISGADGTSYAVALVEGKLISMRQQVSASGIRYVALDEQMGYRLYSKGNEATLKFLEADHTAEEQVLLSACSVLEADDMQN